MRVAVLLLAVGLAACGPSKNSVDVADVNARDALDQISSLRSRMDELESQVADLETEIQNEAATREDEDATLEGDIRSHTHY